jgi:hypothetical protein
MFSILISAHLIKFNILFLKISVLSIDIVKKLKSTLESIKLIQLKKFITLVAKNFHLLSLSASKDTKV